MKIRARLAALREVGTPHLGEDGENEGTTDGEGDGDRDGEGGGDRKEGG